MTKAGSLNWSLAYSFRGLGLVYSYLDREWMPGRHCSELRAHSDTQIAGRNIQNGPGVGF